MERGRGALEVSDKMPSWTEFYQSLEKPPQKGFVCFPCCCWWLNLTRRPLESLCLGGKGALGLVMGTELASLRNYGDATPPRHGLLPPLQSNAARQPLYSLRKIYKLQFHENCSIDPKIWSPFLRPKRSVGHYFAIIWWYYDISIQNHDSEA